MKTVTTHNAKTHLSQMLKEIQHGESYIILNRNQPVGKLIACNEKPFTRNVGEITSEPVVCDDDAFLPLSDADLKDWGL